MRNLYSIWRIVFGVLLFLFALFLGYVQFQPDPIEEWLPYSTVTQHLLLVRHQNYILGYHESSKQPAWVLYELLASELTGKRQQRSNNFREDPKILTGSASLMDYRKSGYDRGHLAPAADMAFSATAMNESFYLSNISPQKPGFNRGIWRELESLIRTWAIQYQRLIIVTAGVVTGESIEQISYIGENRVWVPRYYYKIVYDPHRKTMIAFLLENQSYQFRPDEDLAIFATSVDQIEKMTKLDFFPRIPDVEEKRMEAYSDVQDWDFEE